MKVKNLNKSSEKTRKLIKECFAIILKEKKELNKVSVKEITTLANIDRSTFYTHFSDVYDVARDYEDEIMSTLFKENNIFDFNTFLNNIFDFLKENDELYKMILICPDSDFFLNSLKMKIMQQLEKNLSLKKETSIFFVHGIVGMIIDYYRNNQNNITLDSIKNNAKQIYQKIF